MVSQVLLIQIGAVSQPCTGREGWQHWLETPMHNIPMLQLDDRRQIPLDKTHYIHFPFFPRMSLWVGQMDQTLPHPLTNCVIWAGTGLKNTACSLSMDRE